MLPYGIADFVRVKTEGYYYIDKTRFIPVIEKYPPFAFLLRPKRFGKSLFMNMLSCYYDTFYSTRFEEIFHDTFIFKNKTREHGKYHILKLDFSAVNTVGDMDANFSIYCNICIEDFINKYSLDLQIDKNLAAHKNLTYLLKYCKIKGIEIYLMIDEYDNFINAILTHDEEDYQRMVSSKSEAIFKEFFKAVKSGTTDNSSPLKKMLITGVTPTGIFDVASGANIGVNLTFEPSFADAIGVTNQEFEQLLRHYGLTIKDKGLFDKWYNNYRFDKMQKEPMYNTDMVLYYCKSLLLRNEPPENLVDDNLRTDYSKLKFLVYPDKKLNGNFSVLSNLFSEDLVTTPVLKEAYSALKLKDRDNYISFLYHLGFITLSGYRHGEYCFKIPNQTIRHLVAEYLQSIHEDSKLMDIDLMAYRKTVARLAYDGSLEMFDYLAKAIKDNSVIRDYIDGEGFVKGFLVAYLSLTPYYAVLTEVERNKSYIDICCKRALNIEDEIIEPVIEIKYIARNKFSEQLLNEKILEAKDQLQRFSPHGMERGIVVVYNGWEMVYCDWV